MGGINIDIYEKYRDFQHLHEIKVTKSKFIKKLKKTFLLIYNLFGTRHRLRVAVIQAKGMVLFVEAHTAVRSANDYAVLSATAQKCCRKWAKWLHGQTLVNRPNS